MRKGRAGGLISFCYLLLTYWVMSFWVLTLIPGDARFQATEVYYHNQGRNNGRNWLWRDEWLQWGGFKDEDISSFIISGVKDQDRKMSVMVRGMCQVKYICYKHDIYIYYPLCKILLKPLWPLVVNY